MTKSHVTPHKIPYYPCVFHLILYVTSVACHFMHTTSAALPYHAHDKCSTVSPYTTTTMVLCTNVMHKRFLTLFCWRESFLPHLNAINTVGQSR